MPKLHFGTKNSILAKTTEVPFIGFTAPSEVRRLPLLMKRIIFLRFISFPRIYKARLYSKQSIAIQADHTWCIDEKKRPWRKRNLDHSPSNPDVRR